MDYVTLNNGYQMPILGLGTFLSEVDDCYNACLHALKSGYRLIDTAQNYKNEKAVGRAIKDSKVKREEIFVTSKLQIKRMGYNNTKLAVKRSLEDLGLSYIDLYLIHWPSQSDEMNIETYKALEEMVDAGLIRSIGVSNFQIHHLEHLLPHTRIKPVLNQIELHVGLAQEKLVKYLHKNDIAVQSYGPFMKGEALKIKEVEELSEKYNKTPAQICIRYLIDRNILAIPKSVHDDRIDENFNVFDFKLSDEDINKLLAANMGKRVYLDPDNRPGIPKKELDHFAEEF